MKIIHFTYHWKIKSSIAQNEVQAMLCKARMVRPVVVAPSHRNVVVCVGHRAKKRAARLQTPVDRAYQRKQVLAGNVLKNVEGGNKFELKGTGTQELGRIADVLNAQTLGKCCVYLFRAYVNTEAVTITHARIGEQRKSHAAANVEDGRIMTRWKIG